MKLHIRVQETTSYKESTQRQNFGFDQIWVLIYHGHWWAVGVRDPSKDWSLVQKNQAGPPPPKLRKKCAKVKSGINHCSATFTKNKVIFAPPKLREFDERLVDMIPYTLVNNISRDKKDKYKTHHALQKKKKFI